MTDNKGGFKWAEYIFIFSFMVLIVSLSFLAQPFSLFLVTLIPLPILIASYRHGTLLGGIIAALVSAFFALFLQDASLVILVISMATVGIGLGNALKENFPSKKVLIIGIVASLITISLLGLGLSLITKQPLLALYQETTDKVIKEIHDRGVFSQAQIEVVQETLATLPLLFPSMLITGSIFIAGINFLAGSSVLKRLGEDVVTLPPISQWMFPWWVSLLYVILFPLNMINTYPVINIIVQNLLSVVRWFLVLQGICIILYFLNSTRMANWLKALILFPVYAFSNWFLVLIGLLDPWLKYRGRARIYQEELKKQKENQKKPE